MQVTTRELEPLQDAYTRAQFEKLHAALEEIRAEVRTGARVRFELVRIKPAPIVIETVGTEQELESFISRKFPLYVVRRID